MDAYLFQQLSTVQDGLMPAPPTLASDTTIAPTTFLTLVSGTAAITRITPPIDGVHMLVIVPTGSLATFLTTGNISKAIVPTVGMPIVLIYNPIAATYYGGVLKLS